MKSVRIQSSHSRGKNYWNKYSVKKKNVSYLDRPTPLDFDAFVPWFCLELQVPKNIIVTRTHQAEYIRYSSKVSKSSSKTSKSKSRSTKMKLSTVKSEQNENKTTEIRKTTSLATRATDIQDAIHITTYYDKHDHLVEIAIVRCNFPIPRKVIQAFNLCLPFHLGLFKLSITKGGVNHIVLYEISKLLPHSNITDICLDDSFVPEGNYSLLLDQPSHIKYLSLKRCGINDEQCRKIAEKLDLNGTAAKNLLLLDLTSNKIMDEGARALGEILKKNRSLLHLNISDNNISDFGASFILKYLKEFPLTFDDIKEQRFRRFNYLKSKAVIYKKCLDEEKLARLHRSSENAPSMDKLLPLIEDPEKTRKSKPKTNVPSFAGNANISVEDAADNKSNEIIGKFDDPFKEEYTRREDDILYAVGNLSFCSLNLAYNDLTLLSIRKIMEVLKYQSGENRINHIGLMKVVVDGNNIPPRCDELDEIEVYLKRAILKNESHTTTTLLSPTNSSIISGKRK